MALLDSLRRRFGFGAPGAGTPYENVVYLGPTVPEVMGMSADELYRTQPHLRTVVSFVARNIAQLGLHTFERVSDTDRRRVHDDPVALTLRAPNPGMTGYELIFGLVADLKLYDVALWSVAQSTESESGWQILPIPPAWVNSTGGGTPWWPDWVEVIAPNGARSIVTSDEFLLFRGWNPGDPKGYASPVVSLKSILAEQIHAWSYRQQVWERGGRVGAVMTRPADAPEWSGPAREKFQRDWASKWTSKNGPKAGGTPILEDGMDLKRIGFSAREDEWSEVAKLSLSTVASVYHVNPTMVGVLDNANYSNVKEFRRALYGDTLGPDMAMIEDRLNTFLVPRMSTRAGLYVEFNIDEKLQGSFEEQAAVLSSSTGAPWMTRNEARSLRNLPAVEGADDLVVPLNVLVGGQASPRDSGSQNGTGQASIDPDAVKERAPETYEQQAERLLKTFFRRQRSAVLSVLGGKAAAEWWDESRWNKELSDDLFRLATLTATEIGQRAAESLGFDAETYDEARTLAFLRAVSDSRASMINSTTKDQIAAALASDVEEKTPAHVFDVAESSRAPEAAVTLVTTLSAFGTTEAAKQSAGDQATKTWRTTSTNPRSSHARMNGETVGVGEKFSNGMDWPGDPAGGADEVAGCKCSVDISIP